MKVNIKLTDCMLANFRNRKPSVLGLSDKELKPKFHLPIMETDGMVTSVWNYAVIFRPRAGAIGLLMITRRFDHISIQKKKAQAGIRLPLGKSMV